MQSTPLHPAVLAAMDPGAAVRLLRADHGGRPATPRAEIADSWCRLLRQGLDPGTVPASPRPLPRAETERRRAGSPLGEVLPVLRSSLVSIAESARHVMVVADADGRMLWREGEATVLRKADTHGFVLGADLREESIGTNATGTALVTRRPVRVHASEHYVTAHTTWTCAGSPVTDPRDGRLIGAVTVSGPLSTLHPATLALVTSVTRLAEAELRQRHFAALDLLRGVASPLLGRLGGRAVAVDANGWPAAVVGMPPPGRVALPKDLSGGARWLPSLGMCAVEPLPGGWLIRVADPATEFHAARVVLDLSKPRAPLVTVRGQAGGWTRELSPRHAEVLYALALHPEGRTAAELARDIFADATRTVTVRAEFSRLRRLLAPVLSSRPYRFTEGVRVDLIAPGGTECANSPDSPNNTDNADSRGSTGSTDAVATPGPPPEP
ncbi:GAF domain-containing protein [Streptomyces sp. NPDC057638]|uniref:GAF domain-containing protein n=1 Tax=Streptomyces sp. NPDC057638 TaxID=3346190 RepID=UPI00369577B1